MNRSGIFNYAKLIFGSILLLACIAGLVGHCGTTLSKRNRHLTGAPSKKDAIKWLFEGAGIYFFNRYHPTWKRGIQETREDQKEQSDLFQYHLNIEHVVETDPKIQTNHRRPTIYFHGWGDIKNSAKLLKAFCDVLPGDLVTFHFRDRGVLIPKIRYANLGQLPDVLSAIYALRWTVEKLQPEAIDLFGYSRGGATLLNTIAVLNDKSGVFDAELARIGITSHMRAKLLTLIQNGCHVLNCPLTDMNVTMHEFVKHKMGSFVQRKMPSIMKAFEKITHYKSTGLQGIASAQAFKGLSLNMLVHFQHHDTIVSNRNDVRLYDALYQHNPDTTFLVLGNDGGHLHSHGALAHTVHTFKKRFSSSYDREYVLQYKATKQTMPEAQQLSRPGNDAQKLIEAYYAECEACKEQKKRSSKREKVNRIVQVVEE